MDDHAKIAFLRDTIELINDGTGRERGLAMVTAQLSQRAGDPVLPIAELLYELVEETDGTVGATAAFLVSALVALVESYAEYTGIPAAQFVQAFVRAGVQ